MKPNTLQDEELEKRKLQQIISEKEILLIELIEEIEHFKADLLIVKQEYDIKIGRLYLKLDEIELEILKLKKIEELIKSGSSFEEAQRVIDGSLKERYEYIKGEYTKLNDEEKDIKKRNAISEEDQVELKRLFRKLAHKFHPDLNNGDDSMMKKINQAYADFDLEALRTMDQGEFTKNTEINTIEKLNSNLAILEESIKKILSDREQLMQSEWAILKESTEDALKQGRDILGELANKVIADITEKQNILDELRNKNGQ